MKTFTKVLTVVLLGLAVGGLVFWGFTRTDYYVKLKRKQIAVVQEALPIVYYTDPDVGPMLLPHTKIHYLTPFFETTVVTNAEGFTGRDYPVTSMADYRVAIMGDSAVEAYGVADTTRFPATTERLIYEKTKGRRRVEVMGFGVSGWGTVHHYAAIRKYVLKYKPNEIWLMFLPNNEIGDNTPLLNAPPNGPTFIYKSPDSDEIVDIRFGYPDVPEALEAERNRRYSPYLKETWGKWAAGLVPYYWSPEHSPHWDLVMSHTMQTLKLTKKLCDQNGIKLALVYRVTGYDNTERAFNELKGEAAAFLKRDLPMERSLGVTRFRKQVEDLGIDFINTLDMEKAGIITKADETEVSKHVEMAQYLSGIIIQRLDARDAKKTGK